MFGLPLWLVIVYGIGFVVSSPFALFVWALGCGFASDSTHTPTVIKSQLYYTFLGFAMTWLWFITWPILIVSDRSENKRITIRNAAYEERLSHGENYGKLFTISNLFPRNDFVGAKVKIIQWNDGNLPYVQAVDKPVNGYTIDFRFYVSGEYLNAV